MMKFSQVTKQNQAQVEKERFLDLAKRRCSCRKYEEKPVEQEKLDLILEAARVAPTGCNRQPFHIYIIRSREGMEKLSRACRTFGAPLALLVCADKNEAWIRPEDQKQIGEIDASIVTDHMMLQATELGLGSVWVCHFDPAVVKNEFHLPGHLEPVNLLFVGYAAVSPASPDRHKKLRKPMEDLVSYETEEA